jgi:hypothetical protein
LGSFGIIAKVKENGRGWAATPAHCPASLLLGLLLFNGIFGMEREK